MSGLNETTVILPLFSFLPKIYRDFGIFRGHAHLFLPLYYLSNSVVERNEKDSISFLEFYCRFFR
ncbi:hypothetical protein AKJ52_00040 [candidate division MSBL1 archaeon SCGC-AAA382C18]|uniref:Uncharacterized protein n=1 Tax=candidate division MSBL1 archaeon SCGC-AAA382C18 TaxID=1698281 RepID=A0A133VLZ5_9EURY|nr:hypothetical protein AKJ52_00040 [candidate division MSBL1 archaeon SCGC-AAA382C18]